MSFLTVTVHERGEADDPLSALKGLGEQNTFHYWVMASNIVAIIARYRASEKIRNGIARNVIYITVTVQLHVTVASQLKSNTVFETQKPNNN